MLTRNCSLILALPRTQIDASIVIARIDYVDGHAPIGQRLNCCWCSRLGEPWVTRFYFTSRGAATQLSPKARLVSLGSHSPIWFISRGAATDERGVVRIRNDRPNPV